MFRYHRTVQDRPTHHQQAHDLASRLRATDRRTLEPAATFTEHGTHTVCRSDRFSNWYHANHIEIRDADGRTLDDWERRFRDLFEPDRFEHLTLILPDRPEIQPLLDEARNRTDDGLTLESYRWLLATDPPDDATLAPAFTIRAVRSEQDWAQLRQFDLAEAREQPWYTSDADAARFLDAHRFVADKIDVDWLRLTPSDSDEILARLGIFKHAGLCRLQSVGTAAPHRRQGHASRLLRHAIHEAVVTRAADGLALATEDDSDAHRLYTSLGFRDVAREHWIFRYPKAPTAADG